MNCGLLLHAVKRTCASGTYTVVLLVAMTSALAFQMYKIHQFQVMVKPSTQGLHNGDLVPPLRATTLAARGNSPENM